MQKQEEEKKRQEEEAARKQREEEDKADLKRGPGAGMKLAEKRDFNESEIMGDVERNHLGLPTNLHEAPDGSYLDAEGRTVSAKGYLLDPRGNVLDKAGKLMFRRVQLTRDGDLPVPANIGRFNFTPFKITGSFQSKAKQPDDVFDNNKRMINHQGFLIDSKGHIVNQKGKVVLDRCYLKEDGSFPEMLNY